ncbi:MAG: hypothetical protein QXM27_02540 [Candidatus Pacearchaeota archaeon]
MLTKEDIISQIKNFISDEKRIEFLERILPKQTDKETRKFILLTLANLYEKKQMFNSALTYYTQLSSLLVKFKEQQEIFLKIAKLYVKIFNFSAAEDYLKKAIAASNKSEEERIRQEYIKFCLDEAADYEKKKKILKAIKIYEYLASRDINKIDMLRKIAYLYEKDSMPLEAAKIKRYIKEIEKKEKKE